MLEAVAEYVRQKQWVVFSLVALWGVFIAQRTLRISFHSYSGLVLSIRFIILTDVFLLAIKYSIRHEIFGDIRLSAFRI